MKINGYIDHTILRPDAAADDIRRLCREAVENSFFAVCVNPCWVMLAKNALKDSKVKVASVAGFPLGSNRMETKVREAVIAIEDGADEIDMVMNIGEFKTGNRESVLNEMIGMREAVGPRTLKVIVETCLLTDAEKEEVLEMTVRAKADFIKTSTGFSKGGATEDDVRLFHSLAKGRILVKASGGIKDFKTAEMMIKAGAARLGTSSSVQIAAEADGRS